MKGFAGITRENRLHVLRRMTQVLFIAFVFLMPVLDILRYDAASRELIVLGRVWGLGVDEGLLAGRGLEGSGHIALRFFLRAILPWLFLLAIFPFMGFIGGRLFCGWLCPEGALFELYDHLTAKAIGRKDLLGDGRKNPSGMDRCLAANRRRIGYAMTALFVMAAIQILAGLSLTGFFIAPQRIWSEVFALKLSGGVKAGVAGVFIYMTVTGLVVRHAFCKYVCAAGLMQTLFGWISPVSVRVRFASENISRCTDCRGCERACFMNIKPRTNRRDISCVNCGECITACRRELGSGCLFGYTMGGDTRGAAEGAPLAGGAAQRSSA